MAINPAMIAVLAEAPANPLPAVEIDNVHDFHDQLLANPQFMFTTGRLSFWERRTVDLTTEFFALLDQDQVVVHPAGQWHTLDRWVAAAQATRNGIDGEHAVIDEAILRYNQFLLFDREETLSWSTLRQALPPFILQFKRAWPFPAALNEPDLHISCGFKSWNLALTRSKALIEQHAKFKSILIGKKADARRINAMYAQDLARLDLACNGTPISVKTLAYLHCALDKGNRGTELILAPPENVEDVPNEGIYQNLTKLKEQGSKKMTVTSLITNPLCLASMRNYMYNVREMIDQQNGPRSHWNISSFFLFNSIPLLDQHIDNLAVRAGYPKGYFSSSSPRKGYFITLIGKHVLNDGYPLGQAMTMALQELGWKAKEVAGHYEGEVLKCLKGWREIGFHDFGNLSIYRHLHRDLQEIYVTEPAFLSTWFRSHLHFVKIGCSPAWRQRVSNLYNYMVIQQGVHAPHPPNFQAAWNLYHLVPANQAKMQNVFYNHICPMVVTGWQGAVPFILHPSIQMAVNNLVATDGPGNNVMERAIWVVIMQLVISNRLTSDTLAVPGQPSVVVDPNMIAYYGRPKPTSIPRYRPAHRYNISECICFRAAWEHFSKRAKIRGMPTIYPNKGGLLNLLDLEEGQARFIDHMGGTKFVTLQEILEVPDNWAPHIGGGGGPGPGGGGGPGGNGGGAGGTGRLGIHMDGANGGGFDGGDGGGEGGNCGDGGGKGDNEDDTSLRDYSNRYRELPPFHVYSHETFCTVCSNSFRGSSLNAVANHFNKCKKMTEDMKMETNFSEISRKIKEIKLKLRPDIVKNVMRVQCLQCFRHYANKNSYYCHSKARGCTGLHWKYLKCLQLSTGIVITQSEAAEMKPSAVPTACIPQIDIGKIYSQSRHEGDKCTQLPIATVTPLKGVNPHSTKRSASSTSASTRPASPMVLERLFSIFRVTPVGVFCSVPDCINCTTKPLGTSKSAISRHLGKHNVRVSNQGKLVNLIQDAVKEQKMIDPTNYIDTSVPKKTKFICSQCKLCTDTQNGFYCHRNRSKKSKGPCQFALPIEVQCDATIFDATNVP